MPNEHANDVLVTVVSKEMIIWLLIVCKIDKESKGQYQKNAFPLHRGKSFTSNRE